MSHQDERRLLFFDLNPGWHGIMNSITRRTGYSLRSPKSLRTFRDYLKEGYSVYLIGDGIYGIPRDLPHAKRRMEATKIVVLRLAEDVRNVKGQNAPVAVLGSDPSSRFLYEKNGLVFFEKSREGQEELEKYLRALK